MNTEDKFIFQIPNSVLYEAVINKTSLALSVAQLDTELLKYINRIIEGTPQSLLAIPIQHPFKHYTALLVCLIDYVDGDETRRAYTEMVQECFRYPTMQLQCIRQLSVEIFQLNVIYIN